jgi:hypothetical protein
MARFFGFVLIAAIGACAYYTYDDTAAATDTARHVAHVAAGVVGEAAATVSTATENPAKRREQAAGAAAR